MTALPKPGTPAPPFELAGLDGPALVFPGAASARATLLFFVKHDCATCALVAPVVEELHRTLGSHGLRTVAVSQSDARETREFLTANELSMPAVLDVDLDVSDQYGFDAVPAPVLTTSDGRVLASFEGWVRADWQTVIRAALAACEARDVSTSGLDAASAPLPESRPGCGSRAHDPDVARRLAVKRGSERLAARRVRIPVGDDPFEFLADGGLTDGLPVVPPTEDRVLRMLEGTSRAATDVVALIPPNLEAASVEKVAVNAVMAGCRPEYLPVVLAAVEAACTDTFNLHGVLATTYFVR